MRTKLTEAHLERRAYVYVRQSTAMQIHEHVESTKRQYALADRAENLGWSRDEIEVIDEDQGRRVQNAPSKITYGVRITYPVDPHVGLILPVWRIGNRIRAE